MSDLMFEVFPSLTTDKWLHEVDGPFYHCKLFYRATIL